MIFFGLLIIILTIALFSLKISTINFNRITIVLLLYSGILTYNILYIDFIKSGISIYNGLFQVTIITQGIDLFIYLIGILILLLSESIFKNNFNIKFTLSSTKNLININKKNIKSNEINNNSKDNIYNYEIKFNKNLSIIAEYSLIVLFTILGITSLISSNDLVSIFLSIELQSFAIYILATIYRESESATSAGLKYFLLGSLSSAIILLGSGLLYSFTGLTNFEELYIFCSTIIYNYYIEFSVLLIMIGLLFKVAAAPFHNWAPDVYDGVPTLVTTWLTTIPKISLLIFILEFQGFNQLINWSSWTYLLLISSLLSLIVGTIGGLTQYRIKRLLAYSTISHIGFLLIALVINSEESIESFLFYLIQYSLTNVNIFFIIIVFGSLIHFQKLYPFSPVQFISQLKGQFYINPLLGLSLAISLFSLAGIPPLIGFFGKLIILYAVTHNGYFFLAIIIIIVSVISAAYYLKIIKVIHFDSLNLTEILSWTFYQSQIKFKLRKKNQEELKFTILNSNKNLSLLEIKSEETNSFVIAIITLILIFFILNPTPLLNSVHLLI